MSVAGTERLLAEPLSPENLAFHQALLADPLVGETLGGVRTAAQTAELHHVLAARWERDGLGFVIWRERATGEPVARGGAQWTRIDGEDVVEIGWAVRSDRWGEGFATELGRESIALAARSGIPEVVAFTLPHNRASRRVMEKLGMSYEREFEHGPWGTHVLYRLATA